MKPILKPKYLPWVVVLLGIVGCALRGSLYAFFVDARNLLPRMHPVTLALLAVTALTAGLVVLTVRCCTGSERYRDNFPVSLPAALGHILLASGILLTVLPYPAVMPGLVGKLWRFLGIASAPLLCYAGFSRALGKKPFFLGYVAVSVFFALHLVCHYRVWCSDPQLQNYFFAFTASLGLMLFGYYQAAVCVRMGNRRMLLGTGLVTAYLCLVSLPNVDYMYLYLGGAVWSLTGLCVMEGVLSRREKAGDGYDAP